MLRLDKQVREIMLCISIEITIDTVRIIDLSRYSVPFRIYTFKFLSYFNSICKV